MQVNTQCDHEMALIIRSHGMPCRTWQRLLAAILELSGRKAELLRHAERTWASATFSGTRHTIALVFTGEEGVSVGEAFMEALPEHEFNIPGQLVADATVASVTHEIVPEIRLIVEMELLLLEDA